MKIEKKVTMSSRRQNQQIAGVPPELVKDYDVELINKMEEEENESIEFIWNK